MRDQGYSCDGACDASAGARAPAARTPTSSRCSTSTCRASPASSCSPISAASTRTVAVVMVTGEDSTEARDDGDRARRLRLPGQAGRVRRAADQRRQRAAPPAQRAREPPVSWSACRATVQERSDKLAGGAAGSRALRDQGLGLPGRNDLPAGADGRVSRRGDRAPPAAHELLLRDPRRADRALRGALRARAPRQPAARRRQGRGPRQHPAQAAASSPRRSSRSSRATPRPATRCSRARPRRSCSWAR